MARYGFKVIHTPFHMPDQDLEEELNRWGGQGWDLHLLEPGRLVLRTELTLPELPPHRTAASTVGCATCDGGGCPDCTDPA
jgi:hypothetical protein